jgi:hypothetical protein
MTRGRPTGAKGTRSEEEIGNVGAYVADDIVGGK